MSTRPPRVRSTKSRRQHRTMPPPESVVNDGPQVVPPTRSKQSSPQMEDVALQVAMPPQQELPPASGGTMKWLLLALVIVLGIIVIGLVVFNINTYRQVQTLSIEQKAHVSEGEVRDALEVSNNNMQQHILQLRDSMRDGMQRLAQGQAKLVGSPQTDRPQLRPRNPHDGSLQNHESAPVKTSNLPPIPEDPEDRESLPPPSPEVHAPGEIVFTDAEADSPAKQPQTHYGEQVSTAPAAASAAMLIMQRTGRRGTTTDTSSRVEEVHSDDEN